MRYEDGTIRIRVGAAPEDGRATEAARRALAKALGLRRTAVSRRLSGAYLMSCAPD